MTRRLDGQGDLSGGQPELYDYRAEGRGRDVRWRVIGQFGYRLNPRIRTGLEAGWVRSDSTTRPRRRSDGVALGLVLDYGI